MAKSLVEKYEQILAQDPASTVFVELAKALLERAEDERAIEVCRNGLEHHADSVVGRVLWGKALINLGRPAEAMEQFDQAIAIDRSNPHAYNLIGEVLLHKGLYRSALPLLKKAVALQPNDGRVRQWLEQTQAALAGGPAPILGDPTQVELPAHTAVDSAPPPAALADEDREKTEVSVPAYVPAEAPASEDPFSAVPKRTTTSEVIGGMTATFDALAETQKPEENPFDAVARGTPEAPENVERAATASLSISIDLPVDEPTVAVSEELLRDGAVEQHAPSIPAPGPGSASTAADPPPPLEPVSAPAPEEDGGLLGHLPAPSGELPAPSRPAPRPNPEIPVLRPSTPKGGGGLLGDLPDLLEPTSSIEVPKVEVSAQAAEAIAREYERELREKLAQNKAQKSFLARHWLKLAAGGVVSLVLIVGAVVYWQTISANQGSLVDALAEAKKRIAEDTRSSYVGALEALERAVRMDEENAEAWALTARAHAALFAEHGGQDSDRSKALAALAHPGVRDGFPGMALVVEYELAYPKARKEQVGAVLAAAADDADLHELAGGILMAQGDEKAARDRLQKALGLQPAHVRALVAVGDYFRRSGDFTQALEFYGRATKVSPHHPGAVLGAAESRLELGRDLEAALEEVARLPDDPELPEAARPRRVLVRGQLLAATGKPDEGIDLLKVGASKYRLQAFDFQFALGKAFRIAGRMKEAQQALENALEIRAKNADAREALAQVLVARGRSREVLKKVEADPDSRRISLVRGQAWAQLGEWKRARVELERTQVDGRYPSEAVVLLALADAHEGKEDRAKEVLEKILSVTKKARGEVLVALGEVHLRRGELDKARARFEEAAKEGDDPEASCAWGRMLVRLGTPHLAVEPLERAVARNDSHDEAHEALARAYLQLGKVPEALALTTRWQQTNDDSALARRMGAWALYQSGKLKEADSAAWKSIREDPRAPEAWRIRAMVNFAQGDTRTGFSALERANKLDPKDPETFCSIGRAFLRQGNAEHAEAAFSAAVREKADSVCGRIGLHWAKLPSASRSSVKELEQLGREAIPVWDKSFAQAALARAMLATGEAKSARARADEAVQLAPWSGDAHLALGLVAERLRDTSVAKEAFARAVELEPAHSGYRLEYADALARGDEEDQKKAVGEYERFLRLGGSDRDEARVKRTLASLKRRLAAR